MTRLRKDFLLNPLRFWVLMALLSGCSGLEQSEQESLRRANAKGEFIHRTQGEAHYAIETPKLILRSRYPWEQAYVGKHTKITKEFFRCKGSSSNPPHADHKDPGRPANYFDCGGSQKHSLPLRNDKEFVYPILTELLNHIQTKTGCKVVITSGHRCPVHNAYADNSTANQHSKHMIGAEVDFYVQGMEEKPQEIVDLLLRYYKEMPEKTLHEFQRLEKLDSPLVTPAWYNKEILIKLQKKNEGRDFDNRHPYPYITLQVRYDRDLNEKVVSSWQKAFNQYKRY